MNAPDSRQISAAVIVTHFPERDRLVSMLGRLPGQVGWLIIVDNGSGQQCEKFLSDFAGNHPGVNLIALKENKGLGFAQNQGIRKAIELGAEQVLLMDQDGMPDPDMVQKLQAALDLLSESGEQVAAVGPYLECDRGSSLSPFNRVTGFRRKRLHCRSVSDGPFLVDCLFASGSLIPVKVFEKVGLMDEDFFIEYIDIDWGLRAASLGYRSFGVCTARMKHQLGESDVVFFGFSIPRHAPVRDYYSVRNALVFYRRNYVSWAWGFRDGLRVFFRFLVLFTVSPDRFRRLALFGRGVLDGVRGKLGRAD
ncbi:MAG: glycosyltransferase family 2 protein [Halothiobacillaceae bacterium]